MTDKKAENWAKKNPWFGKDLEMTDAAYEIHADLIKEKIQPNTNEYYKELNKKIKMLFPHKF
jgi:hypothetical protein